MNRKNEITITLYVSKDNKLLNHMHYSERDSTYYTAGLKYYEELKRAVLNPVYISAETGEIVEYKTEK